MSVPAIPLTIAYRQPGTKPPVFVAGDFLGAQWQPQEMDYVEEDGEFTFKAEVLAEPGSRVQYKFRLGTGDWWAVDPNAPTQTDNAGNQNNVAEIPPLAEPSSPPAVAEKARRILKGDEPLKVEQTAAAASAPQPVRGSSKSSEGGGNSAQRPTVANAALEILNRSAPQSGASTPSFVRTAAEVADSAALLDKEESEPDMPDEEAGRRGFRRLSSTPIQQVADTAADVADTAASIDRGKALPERELSPAEPDGEEPLDETPLVENTVPLFAHECAGLPEDQVSDRRDSYPAGEIDLSSDSESGNENYDDPTLERFPSEKEDIIKTVQKLEGGLDDNSAVGTSVRLGDDLEQDPAELRKSRHLRIPRSSRSSASSDRSSAVSLQSIPETEETVDERDFADVPKPVGKAQGSALEVGHSSSASDVEASKGSSSQQTLPERDTGSSNVSTQRNPEEANPSATPSLEGEMAQNPRTSIGSDTNPKQVTSSGSSTALTQEHDTEEDRSVEAENTTADRSVARRAEAPDRVGTPSSVQSATLGPGKATSWLQAFFRTLFVDWIGSLIGRLYGGWRRS
ncbi:hypothetical protein VTK73DRAFT_873 [Phialemonium thermophilum]|uniref:AMP-activated protein kinase glycogen-binding domain-containing protein n=1 Tax=Phialemonium thermophilum TaxID=223376 RepID=A0ABR3Y4I6_9PEZI